MSLTAGRPSFERLTAGEPNLERSLPVEGIDTIEGIDIVERPVVKRGAGEGGASGGSSVEKYSSVSQCISMSGPGRSSTVMSGKLCDLKAMAIVVRYQSLHGREPECAYQQKKHLGEVAC